MELVRILIADDHPIVREGLSGLISTEPGMEVVGVATDGAEAVRLFGSLHPDVLLLDLVMPRKNGLTALTEIIQEWPDARVLILTSFAEDDQVVAALKVGAMGYLLKDSSPNELLQAIRDVARGETPLAPAIARKLVRELNKPAPQPSAEDSLTEREREVLCLLARGLSNQQIADALVLSERTVRSHVSSILQKLNLSSRTQAVLHAIRAGIAQVDCAH